MIEQRRHRDEHASVPTQNSDSGSGKPELPLDEHSMPSIDRDALRQELAANAAPQGAQPHDHARAPGERPAVTDPTPGGDLDHQAVAHSAAPGLDSIIQAEKQQRQQQAESMERTKQQERSF